MQTHRIFSPILEAVISFAILAYFMGQSLLLLAGAIAIAVWLISEHYWRQEVNRSEVK
jgi:hypothetical protein